MEGLEPEGELYENSRRRLGVEGAVVALDEEALGRTGETGRRGEGGVTSVWSMDVNIAFACSVTMMRQHMKRTTAYTHENPPKSLYSGKKKLRRPSIRLKLAIKYHKMKFEATREENTPARHPRKEENLRASQGY